MSSLSNTKYQSAKEERKLKIHYKAVIENITKYPFGGSGIILMLRNTVYFNSKKITFLEFSFCQNDLLYFDENSAIGIMQHLS